MPPCFGAKPAASQTAPAPLPLAGATKKPKKATAAATAKAAKAPAPAKPKAPRVKAPHAKAPPAKRAKPQVLHDDSSGSDGSDGSDDSESEESDEEFDVEAIMAQRGSGAAYQLLVKWEGFDDEQTWEPASSLKNNSVAQAWLKANAPPRSKKPKAAAAAPPAPEPATAAPPATATCTPAALAPAAPTAPVAPAPPAPTRTAPAPAVPAPMVVRGYTVRDDGDTETRLRKSATDSSADADFVQGTIGWVKNETLVDVIDTAILESGSTFYRIQFKATGMTVSGFVRAKYIRSTELAGERASKRQRAC